MKYIYKTICDFTNKKDESENQDAINISDNNKYHLFSMSDGAGGIGIFCKEWAIAIVNGQPPEPFMNEYQVTEWHRNLSKQFCNCTLKKEDLDDIPYFKREKFFGEGSYATFVYLWVNIDKQEFYFTGLGDTTLFYFKSSENQYKTSLIKPIDSQSNLNENPELINWRSVPICSSLLVSKIYKYSNDDVIIITTDSLSRRIIYQLILLDLQNTESCLNNELIKNINGNFINYIKNKQKLFSVEKFIEYLRKITEKDNVFFKNELTKYIEQNEIEEDDYSIIIIDL